MVYLGGWSWSCPLNERGWLDFSSTSDLLAEIEGFGANLVARLMCFVAGLAWPRASR